MRTIFRCEFGSSVYGTRTPESDTDYKGVFIPDARDILLQRAARNINKDTKSDTTKKNLSTDVDDESYGVHEYLRQLLAGQTFALDMLFTPKQHWKDWSGEWKVIQDNRSKFLHKGVSSFVGYTKQQAAKYGVKGFRVGALKQVIEVLQDQLENATVEDIASYLHPLIVVNANPPEGQPRLIDYVSIPQNDGTNRTYLEVCDRKFELRCTVSYVLKALTKIYDSYGHRAKMAESNDDVDFKALSHAVRVAREAEELLLTGHITFPCPYADLLLKIKTKQMHYKDIEPLIEEGLQRVSVASEKSTLPEKPDYKFADDLIVNLYSLEVDDFIYNDEMLRIWK